MLATDMFGQNFQLHVLSGKVVRRSTLYSEVDTCCKIDTFTGVKQECIKSVQSVPEQISSASSLRVTSYNKLCFPVKAALRAHVKTEYSILAGHHCSDDAVLGVGGVSVLTAWSIIVCHYNC